jgi:hypothetical protein
MPIDNSKIPVHRIENLDNELNNKLSYKILTANTDFNNINETGLFIVNISDNTQEYHQPIKTSEYNNWDWIIQNISEYNNTYIKQIAYLWTNSIQYQRYKSPSDNWSEWYQISGAGLDMPSNKFIDLLAPTSSGQIYTAPANGYYSIKSRGQSTSTYILFDVLDGNSNYLYAMRMVSTNTGDCEQIIPISKNYKLRFIYNNAFDIEYFRFIYANSEVPMNER